MDKRDPKSMTSKEIHDALCTWKEVLSRRYGLNQNERGPAYARMQDLAAELLRRSKAREEQRDDDA